MVRRIEKTVLINSDLSTVWRIITEPDLIKQWMAEPETEFYWAATMEMIKDFIGKPGLR